MDCFLDFVRNWICCASVDDEMIIEKVNNAISNVDELSEQLVDYTHDPVEHHFSTKFKGICRVNNARATPPACGGDAPTKEHEQKMSGAGSETSTELVVADAGDGGTTAEASAAGEELPPVAEVKGVLCTFVGGADNIEVLNDKLAKMDGEIVPIPSPPKDDEPTSVYRVCQDVVEVKNHRRVARSNRPKYISTVVSEIKNKMGRPARNAANMLAVRRMANNIMGRHGLRPTHVRACIEEVISGVFIADEYDRIGGAMLNSNLAAKYEYEATHTVPHGKWGRVWARLKAYFGREPAGYSRQVPDLP